MLIAHANLEPVILGELQNLNVTGLLYNPTQMWNADIDYPYARTPETVSGGARTLRVVAVQKPIRKGCGGRFFWSSLFLLGFCTEIGLRL